MPAQVLFRQDRIKFGGDLFQHAAQVHALGFQRERSEVEARDVKKFVDQIFQPRRLVQGNAGIACAHFRRNLRFIPQQGQIADDAGQRRL